MKHTACVVLLIGMFVVAGCKPFRQSSSPEPQRVETREETKTRVVREFKSLTNAIETYVQSVHHAIKNNAKPAAWVVHSLTAVSLGMRVDRLRQDVETHGIVLDEWDQWLSAMLQELAELSALTAEHL